MPDLVCITDSEYPDTAIEEEILIDAGFSCARYQCSNATDVIRVAGSASALLVQYAPIDSSVIHSLPNLRLVSRYGTGFDNIDIDAATAGEVWVANVPRYGDDEVALHTIALMLGCARGFPYYDAARRQRDWPPSSHPVPLHPGHLTVGVVGAGRIGRRVAELAKTTFGKVVWHDPHLPHDHGIPGTTRSERLNDLLRESNILTVHLPLNRETRHLIDGQALAQLRAPRIVINTSRGEIIDEAALTAALSEDFVWAAGIDVFESELDSDNSLLDSPRLLATPHVAWASQTASDEVRRRATENVVSVLKHGRPITPVNDVTSNG